MTNHLYDPDFDAPPKEEKRAAAVSELNVSPKTAFVAGLGLSVLAFCTIGFFILLIFVL